MCIPVAQGLKALYSPHTGIVDFVAVTQSYVKNFERRGGVVKLGFEVAQFSESSDKPDFPVTIVDKKSVGFCPVTCDHLVLTP